jgi:hypothetical protein
MTTLTASPDRRVGADLGPGDEVVITSLDHDANVRPCGWPPSAPERPFASDFVGTGTGRASLDQLVRFLAG